MMFNFFSLIDKKVNFLAVQDILVLNSKALRYKRFSINSYRHDYIIVMIITKQL